MKADCPRAPGNIQSQRNPKGERNNTLYNVKDLDLSTSLLPLMVLGKTLYVLLGFHLSP